MKIQEKGGIVGKYTIAKVKEDKMREAFLQSYGYYDKKDALLVLPELVKKDNSFFSAKTDTNLIPILLRTTLASKIAGNAVTPTFSCNVIALGDDATVVQPTNTKLNNEILRGEFTSRYNTQNVAYLDRAFDDTEVGGLTILEIGSFVDADPLVANDGFLFSHINVNESMDPDEQLSINVSFTING